MNNVLISLLFFLIFCGQVLAADAIKMTALQQKNPGIKTSLLQASNTSIGQAYPAEVVVPVDQIRVVSTAHAGLLNQLNVTTGQTVKRGQVLAQISSPELITMQRSYLQSQSQLRLAKQSLDRDAALFKDGIIAEKRLQASQSAHREALAMQSEQRQLLNLSGMSGSATKSGRFQNGIALTSPITGVVLEVMVAQGQRVDSTMPLLKVAQLNPLWVEVHVPLADIKKSNIQKGALVNIKDSNASGKVIAMLPSMRSQDQTAIVRAIITQGADNLFPSQMVDAMIAPSQAQAGLQNRFSVPSNALVSSKSRAFVFVQTKAGFEARVVTVNSTQNDTSVISGDFTGTEKIAISGTAAIKGTWLGMGGMEDE